jgi:hypothetical protein
MPMNSGDDAFFAFRLLSVPAGERQFLGPCETIHMDGEKETKSDISVSIEQ